MDYKARYEEWISNSYFDEDTRAELESIKEDENEIKERFYIQQVCAVSSAQEQIV